MHTLVPGAPVASALQIRAGRIAALGEDRDLGPPGPGCRRIALDGATVLPGWVDAHTHLLGYARSRRQVDLSGTRSAAEVARRMAGAPGSGWLVGRGWERHAWVDAAPPDRALLDSISEGRPALAIAHDGHQGWANSLALAQAGIDAGTPDPPGGKIVHAPSGEPTGLLLENALDLVARRVERPSAAEERALLREALGRLVRLGLTRVHDLEDGRAFAHLLALEQDGELPLPVDFFFPGERLEELERLGLAAGLGNERLRVAGVKFFLDGTLGARTAAMLAPYERDPGHQGMLLLAADEFRLRAGRAAAAGLPVAVHCIGDRAVRTALDVLEGLPRLRAPHRIEHAQCVHPDDLPRFARARIVPSMQPAQLFLDLEPAEREWGARARWTYPFRSLLATGAAPAFGSDCPVEDPDPRRGLFAAVARRQVDGTPREGWHPEEALSLREALFAYSIGAAAAAGGAEGPSRGTMAVGARANLVVLERDPFLGPTSDLLTNPVLLTVIDGRVAHSTLG
ncbi:MAG: amidohydrolase [Planctomycetes bacterium]|nr:amidohydrolase [Planctomycetota bacterium]